MKALLLKSNNQWPSPTEMDVPDNQNKVLVKLNASALNHRDVWISRGLYAGIRYPVILGSDGAGVYHDKRVLINPSHGWGDDESFQDKSYRILGMPENGTFAEWLSVDKSYIHEIPGHLNDLEAAALPLAGLTAFRALFTRAQLKKSDRVFVNGIGGGVAQFALLFALANGNEVFVSSGNEEKIEKAIRLGAAGGINYTGKNWGKELLKVSLDGFDVLVDGAGGSGFENLLRICNPGARIAVYGGTQGAISQLNTQQLFWKQISLLGSTMGSERDFQEMLNFVDRYQISPVIDSVYSLEQAGEAFTRMQEGKQFGKIVFDHNK